MAIRKILVPIFGKDKLDNTLDCARQVAARFDAKVDVRFIRPTATAAVIGDVGYGFVSGGLMEQVEQEGIAAAAAAHRRFKAWCAQHDPRLQIVWHDEEGNVGAVVAQRGCLSDLVLMPRAGKKDAPIDEPFDSAVYAAGRLTMLVDEQLSPNFLDHVLIAWNYSTEATHAIAQALPFLAKAGKVSIFTASEAGSEPAETAELVDYLALHGIVAAPVTLPPDNKTIADSLLHAATESGATLIVMGAYTHGRVRQMLFGGVTHQVMTTPGLPALLSH